MTKKKLTAEILKKMQGLTPGLQVQAFHKGKPVINLDIGKTYEYYDMASLTKSMLVSTAFMKLFDQDKSILDKKVQSVIPWYKHKTTTIQKLLSHSSGHFWWKPFYKKITLDLSINEKRMQLEKMLQQEKLFKSSVGVYSDVNFLILGFILEALHEKPLVEIWKEIQTGFSLDKTHFHIDNKPVYKKNQYAPTHICPWRKRRLQGEAMDDNTWSFGGVSSHAGLFGSIQDVSSWILQLRNIYYGKRGWVKPATVRQFFKQQKYDWATGFMMPTPGNSNSGNYFSLKSIGHTGFTGTSFWFDPKNDIVCVMMANRVYFELWNNRMEFRDFRGFVHDGIYKIIKGI